MLSLLFGIACFSSLPPTPASVPSLDKRLRPLVDAYKGQVAIAVKNLRTGETYFLNENQVMPTASLIKLPIMIEVYLQAKEGKHALGDELTLTKDEMVPGSGILTEHFSPGARFSLRDAVRLMIVFSDNTATNMVLEKIGIPTTNQRMRSLGFKETRINAKVFKGSSTSIDPDRTKQYGLGSTTAKEMIGILEMLHEGKFGSKADSTEMLEHLKKCDDKDKFPRFLPKDVTVAHKTGSVSDARTDAGILYFKEGPIALCVLTAKNEDKRWTVDNAGNKLCADVAREVVQYFRDRGVSKDPK